MSDDIRTRLELLRDGLAPRNDEATFEGVLGRRRQRRTRQRLGAAVIAMVVAVAAIGFVIRSFNGAPTVSEGPPIVSPTVVSPHIGRSIKVGPQGGTSDMVSGFGELWVTVSGVSGGQGIHQDALVEVDPQTMETVRTIGVSTVPTWEVGGGGLLATDDALWIAGSTRGATGDVATLVRVDPATGATTTSTWAGADGFVDVATDGTSLWVLGQQGPHPVVTRFDPTTGTFSGDVKLSGDEGRHIVAVPGAVIVSQFTWQGGSGPCLSLASVDPSTNPTLRAEFPTSPCSEENTVGLSPFVIGSDIWTAYKGITFTTVDPATAEPRPVEPPPYAPVNPRSGPVASDTGVWFGDYPGGNGSQPDILTRFDPTTNTVEPTDVRIGWSVAVALGDDLWAMGWDGTLTDIHLQGSTASGSESPSTISVTNGGIQVQVPPGWSVAQENLTPWLSSPTEVLSVGTFDMPVSHHPGDELRVSDAPVAPAALAAMTATDAFVSLQASGSTDAPDDRPSSFRTAKDRPYFSAQTGDYPFTWWWIPFIDQGRAFFLFVAIGNHADKTTTDQAWAIADSIGVGGSVGTSASSVP